MSPTLVVGDGDIAPAVAQAIVRCGAAAEEVTIVGAEDVLRRRIVARASYVVADPHLPMGTDTIAGTRAMMAEMCEGWGLSPLPATIDPGATIGSDVELSPGTVVCAGSRLTTNIRAGAHLVMGPEATLSHDTRVGELVLIGAGSNIAGNVHIGPRTWIGADVAVIQGIRIGEEVVIGPGSVVVRDVPDATRVAGVPAKPV